MAYHSFRWQLVVMVASWTLVACSDDPTDDDTALPDEFGIPDSALESCVRQALDQPQGELTEADVAGLAHLSCPDQGIEEVTGLDRFVALESLWLWENAIVDIGPLADLTALTWLNLDHNRLTDGDLEPLCPLAQLSWLTLEHNQLSDPQALDCFDFADVYAGQTGSDRSGEAAKRSSRHPAATIRSWAAGFGTA